MKEKYNYFITVDRFYDLQFMLPMTFISSGEKSFLNDKVSINEIKISADQ